MFGNNLKIKYLLIGLTVLSLGSGSFDLHAQEAVLVTGGSATQNTGSVSYSVGQMFYTAYTGTNGSMTEGVQQPFEISGPTALEEYYGKLVLVSTYPNPTTDFLSLKVESLELSAWSFQLYDSKGMLLENKKIEGNETIIPMSTYSPSTYFLIVREGNKEIGTFKIIKH